MAGDGPWVLVCENIDSHAADLEALLMESYRVVLAKNKEYAIQLLQGIKTKSDPADRYAVAVIDLSFGRLDSSDNQDGLEILQVAKECDDFLIPIIFSGTIDPPKASMAVKLDVFQLVNKNVTIVGQQESWPLDELRDAIAKAVVYRKKLMLLYRALVKLQDKYPDETEIHDCVSAAYDYLRRERGMKP